jgi:hypothetical protein
MPDAVYTNCTDVELQQALAHASATSIAWHGITAEIQRRQMAEIHKRLQHLEKPHWVVWATFVAGAIAAIAAVILLFR